MMTLWHNPRCSKSRQALALLQQAGHQPAVRLYLKETPSVDEIVTVRNLLDVTADAMMRKGEALFRELGLAASGEEALIAAMAAHPILIERPILIRDSAAVIARPPERALEIV